MNNGFKGTINAAGRPKGAVNKATAKTKIIIEKLVAEELAALPELLAKMKPKDRADVLIKMLPFIVAKNSRLEVDAEITNSFSPVIIQIVEPIDLLE